MKNRFLLQLIVFFSTVFLLWQCRTYTPSVTHENFASQYHAEEKVLRPKYVLYNVTDSLTRLYFSVNSTDLLYAKNNGDDGYTARILLTYVVHPVDYAKIVIDSGHVVMTDVGTPGDSKQLAAGVDMDVTDNGKYFVEVTFRDINKMTASYELLYLDHRGKDSRNNFLITQPKSETPLFKNYLDSGEHFSIRYYDPQVKKLFVHYFRNLAGPAPPPYSMDRHAPSFLPDSSWKITFTPDSVFTFTREGWYTFNSDSLSTDGFTVSRFHEGFPKITIARQMVYPLRYLTMKDEYVAMDTSLNIKKAVDNFWLGSTGSQERAREVIRYFYNRVEAANVLFATQEEGWKTDRGMIYLIFGPPDNVYRYVNYETWIYGNNAGPGGLTFIFDHRDSPFSDQEFVLERNTDFRVNWITAVDAWRQGHVYTLR